MASSREKGGHSRNPFFLGVQSRLELSCRWFTASESGVQRTGAMNKRQSFNSGAVFFSRRNHFIHMHDRLRYAVESNRDRRSGQGTKRGSEERKKDRERERVRGKERERESNEGRNDAKSQWRLTSHDYSSDNDRPQTPDLCMMNAPTRGIVCVDSSPCNSHFFLQLLVRD